MPRQRPKPTAHAQLEVLQPGPCLVLQLQSPDYEARKPWHFEKNGPLFRALQLCYKGEWDVLSLPGAPLCPSLPPASPLTGVHLLSAKGPMRFAPRETMGSSLPPIWTSSFFCDIPVSWQQPHLAHFFPITFLGSHRGSPSRLSHCSFYAKPFLVSLSPPLINILSESPGLVVKSFLHKVRNTDAAGWPEADPL